MTILRSALLLTLWVLPLLGLLEATRSDNAQALFTNTAQHFAVPDTTCPPYREVSERILKRFLSSPGIQEALPDYGIPLADTTEVVTVTDALVCAALDSTHTTALADSVLYFDPEKDYLSYLATDSLYFGVVMSKPLDSLGVDTTPPPGIDGYVYVAMNSVIVFGKDFSYKQAFAY